MERHLITGATGFVGGALVLELIAKTDAELHCLVRSREGADDPEARLASALERTAHQFGREELLADVRQRCRVVEGDIALPGCGVASPRLPAIDEVWHVAASLAFEDEREEQIMRDNVDGTAAVLDLAAGAGARAFNHFSTAYVAGNRSGRIEEVLSDPAVDTNNAYERSKVRGEQVVASSGIGRVRIFRPSVVVGHSTTLAVTSFTGLYGFVRNLVQLRDEVGERLGGYLQHRALRLIGEPSVPLNMVPVDAVAAAAAAVAASDSDELVFHLTNSVGVPVGEGMEVVARAVGIRNPEWVEDRDRLSSIDAEVDERMVFYGSYVRDEKHFDRSHTDAAIGPDALDQPVVRERLVDLVDWSLDYLDAGAKAAVPAGGEL